MARDAMMGCNSVETSLGKFHLDLDASYAGPATAVEAACGMFGMCVCLCIGICMCLPMRVCMCVRCESSVDAGR